MCGKAALRISPITRWFNRIPWAVPRWTRDQRWMYGLPKTPKAKAKARPSRGAGNLGRALFSYGGFSEYGLELVAAFDVDEALIGTSIAGKPVLSFDKMKDLCQRMNIRIGIITVPSEAAQQVCDQMVESGILAIWNFAPGGLAVQKTALSDRTSF